MCTSFKYICLPFRQDFLLVKASLLLFTKCKTEPVHQLCLALDTEMPYNQLIITSETTLNGVDRDNG